jgi:hypothetical protein
MAISFFLRRYSFSEYIIVSSLANSLATSNTSHTLTSFRRHCEYPFRTETKKCNDAQKSHKGDISEELRMIGHGKNPVEIMDYERCL